MKALLNNKLFQVATLLLFLILLAIPLRWNNLSLRPFHADESVQAIKYRAYQQTGEYRYDPNEYHGPLLNYVTAPIHACVAKDINTENEIPLRSVPAVVSLIGIALLLLFRKALNIPGTLVAGLGFVLSPSLLFYSRYYIHETLFITCILLTLGTAWQYSQTKRRRWIILCGASVGLMYATKETFVFNLIAAFGGVLAMAAIEKFKGPTFQFCKNIPLFHYVLAIIAFIFISITLFSSFFTNAAGPIDGIRTYLPWLGRAEGNSPHIWSWTFYLERYFWFSRSKGPVFTELFFLLSALLGVIAAFKSDNTPTHRRLCLFMTVYTLLLAIIYCVIPYKTPWCFMGVMQGLILLGGLGCAYFFAHNYHTITKIVLAILLVAGFAHLYHQGDLLNNKYYEESKNPHVYAHSVSNVRVLARTVDYLSQAHPDGHKMLVQVFASNGDYWPLPWYLRQFDKNAGWYSSIPEHENAVVAPVLIFSPKFTPDLKEKIKDKYQFASIYGFRPNVFLQLAVEKSLWRKYVDEGYAERLEDEEYGDEEE